MKSLDALMWVSLWGLEVYAMDWASISNIWRNMWDWRMLTLDWLFLIIFLVTNQGCILVIQILFCLKYCVSQKLRWHFGIKCGCQLTLIFVFETSRDTLDLKFNVKWILSNIFIGCKYPPTLGWEGFTILAQIGKRTSHCGLIV